MVALPRGPPCRTDFGETMRVMRNGGASPGTAVVVTGVPVVLLVVVAGGRGGGDPPDFSIRNVPVATA